MINPSPAAPENAIMPDRSLTCSRAGDPPCPPNQLGFIGLTKSSVALRSMTSTHLDRAAVEKLFRVRQRRARQIMVGLEGLRVGNAEAVSREALIARLEQAAASGVFGWEASEFLDDLRG